MKKLTKKEILEENKKKTFYLILLITSMTMLSISTIFFCKKKRPVFYNIVKKEIVDTKIIEKNKIEMFDWPLRVEGIISSGQGLRKSIVEDYVVTENKYHYAIDIVVPEKTPVYAAKNGKIEEVWPSYYNGKYKGHPSYGGLIVIKHYDGTYSLYAHLSKTEVQEGQLVSKGQLIGLTGGVKGKRGSGTSTGPHLHFSLTLDILSFLEK